jgi:PAS domain S-box-containing protein
MRIQEARSAVSRFGVALAAAGLALLLKSLLSPVLGVQNPSLTLYPGVVVSAWFGGYWPGTLTTVACVGAIVWGWRGGHAMAFTAVDAADVVGAFLFLMIGLLTSALCGELRAARARAEASAETSGRLASIVSFSDDGIIAITPAGVVTDWNAGAERIFGYPAEEARGKPGALLIDHSGDLSRILERLGRGERVEHFETERTRADGRRIAISVTLSPIRDEGGRLIGASAIVRDITERRQAERTARRAEELLAVTRLANATAHEINNPLTTIVGNLGLLRARVAEDPRSCARIEAMSGAAGMIEEIVQRMGRIVRLQDHAAATSGLPPMIDIRKSAGGIEEDVERAPSPAATREL